MKRAPFVLGLALAVQATACRPASDTFGESSANQEKSAPSSATTGSTTTSPATPPGGKLANVGGTASQSAPDARTTDAAPPSTPGFSLNPDLPVVVRGRWAVALANGASDALGLTSANPHSTLDDVGSGEMATQQMNGTVPAQVLFNVTNDGFTDNPSVVNGLVSYGFLTISALYDNNDHVCGSSGKIKCATAAIRLYTTTAPAAGQAPTPTPTGGGAGLWNAALGVGLPILSGAGTVGYGAANALVVGVDQLTTRNVVTLGDFTFALGTQVPLAVDYTNAPAGSYMATLVIEYVLQ